MTTQFKRKQRGKGLRREVPRWLKYVTIFSGIILLLFLGIWFAEVQSSHQRHRERGKELNREMFQLPDR